MKSSHVGSVSSPEHDMEIDTVTRERLLLDTLVELADTLVADFDVVGLLDLLTRRCAQLFSLKGAGAVLVDQHGYLRVMACSTEQIWLTDVLQAQNHDGPLLDSYRSGKANSDGDLEAARSRWPTFAPLAIDAGIRSVFAFPLHLRDALLGALGLFGTETAALSADEARRAKALADVASVGIVQFAVAHDHDALAARVGIAMQNRTIVEQAQGMLAESNRVELDQAFTLLRRYAQIHDQRLTEVAFTIVTGGLTLPLPVSVDGNETGG